MSAVEQGLGGLWSCLYCEGVWLPAAQAQSVLPELGGVLRAAEHGSPLQADPSVLICPSCEGRDFERLGNSPVGVVRCQGCQSVFMSKGTLMSSAPDAPKVSAEAPVWLTVLAAVGSVAVLDPLPLLLAIQQHEGKKRVP